MYPLTQAGQVKRSSILRCLRQLVIRGNCMASETYLVAVRCVHPVGRGSERRAVFLA